MKMFEKLIYGWKGETFRSATQYILMSANDPLTYARSAVDTACGLWNLKLILRE